MFNIFQNTKNKTLNTIEDLANVVLPFENSEYLISIKNAQEIVGGAKEISLREISTQRERLFTRNELEVSIDKARTRKRVYKALCFSPKRLLELLSSKKSTFKSREHEILIALTYRKILIEYYSFSDVLISFPPKTSKQRE